MEEKQNISTSLKSNENIKIFEGNKLSKNNLIFIILNKRNINKIF